MSALANELSAIEKILDVLLNFPEKVKDALWRRRARAILERLRDLYFHEEGTLGLLRRVARGEPVPASMLEQVESRFHQQEPIVSEALNELRTKADFKDIRFSLDESRLLEDISNDKTTIREWVRDIFHALKNGAIGDWEQKRAQELCDSIEGLNAKFHDADGSIGGRI